MKVILITAVFPPEPVVSATISYDIYSELKLRKHEVKVLCPNPSRPLGFKFSELKKDNNIITLNSYTSPKSKATSRALESISFGFFASAYLLRNRNFDLVYLNGWPIFSQLLIGITSRILQIKSVIHVMDLYPEALKLKNVFIKKVLTKVDSIILNLFNVIICISPTHREYLVESRSINNNKIKHINLWNSSNKGRKIKSIHNENCIVNILYFGNIGPLANLKSIIKEISKNKNNNFQLTIAGSGTEKNNLISLTEKLKLQNINFIAVDRGKEEEVLSNYDVMLLPQKPKTGNTSLPSKLISYMFASKPIIGFVDKNSNIHNIINENKCGYFINSNDNAKLIALFNRLNHVKKSDLNQLGENGFNYAQKIFSKEVNVNKIIDQFESL